MSREPKTRIFREKACGSCVLGAAVGEKAEASSGGGLALEKAGIDSSVKP